jgi:16S rRNA (guanine966-N2)-methyltransferase
MRLIGGKFKNRLLKSPKGSHTRPTSALLRKALFDICRPFIEDATILDVCAGTGAIGLEGLSRGAAHATFVDNDKQAIRCLQENVRALELENQCTILCGDALTALKRLVKAQKQFDLIYIDPPYRHALYQPLLQLLDESTLLAPNGILFVEEASPSHLNTPLSHLTLNKTRKFGNSLLHELTKT